MCQNGTPSLNDVYPSCLQHALASRKSFRPNTTPVHPSREIRSAPSAVERHDTYSLSVELTDVQSELTRGRSHERRDG